MAFEEINAQTEVMNGLYSHTNAIQKLLNTNPLRNDRRYSKAREHLEEAARQLVQAQDEIGAVARLQDQSRKPHPSAIERWRICWGSTRTRCSASSR